MPESRPTIAIIGASDDRSKYGNKAVRAFRDQGWEVFPIHPTLDRGRGIPAFPDLDAVPAPTTRPRELLRSPQDRPEADRRRGAQTVGEVWLNPGSESPELTARAEALGLNVIQACSILDIGQQPWRY